MKNLFYGAFAVLFLIIILLAYQSLTLGNELSEKTEQLNVTELQLTQANKNIENLEKELSETESELKESRETLSSTSEELNETKSLLKNTEEELNITKLQLSETINILNETIDEIILLKEEIVEIEDSINSSIQWFQDNSVLPGSLDFFINRMNSKCVESNKLNLGCAAYIMEDKLHFTYKPEIPDRLYSIEEMYSKMGGDCEDYSLFVKASLNSLRSSGRNLRLEAWEYSDEKYIVYEAEETQYYVPGKGIVLGRLNDVYPYVLCYTTYSDGVDVWGHCIVALSENEIESVDEIGKLNGAETFEPQNGMYLGEVGRTFYICKDGEEYCDKNTNSVILIIGDEDIFRFHEAEWLSYGIYQDSVSSLRNKIETVVG